jgi:bifunctional non-homologous end joining protein LigD
VKRARRSKLSKADIPEFIPFQLAQLVDEPPAGDGWLHEIKFDGYRIQLRVHNGRATVRTRRGHDWTPRFSGLCAAARDLPDCITDGEAVVFEASGHANFGALQSAMQSRHDKGVTFMAFDLLYLNGEDLLRLPLIERKRRLEALLEAVPSAGSRIQYVQHIVGNGPEVHQRGCEMELEGIISKRMSSPYLPGVRNDQWRKIKCGERETFTIGGWRERAGVLSSVMVGEWREGELWYAGKGRVNAYGQTVRDRLKAIETDKMPFTRTSRPEPEERQHWAKPILQAEVSFTAWTKSRHIRHGSFLGLRQDLAPPPQSVARSSHVQRLLPEAVVPSTDELKAYWHKVGNEALKYLGQRPLTVVRHDRGQTFFHTGSFPSVAKSVHQLKIKKREGGTGTRLWVDGVAGLVALVDIGVVELHPWNSTVDHLEHPDIMVFDLDPGVGIQWEFVTDTALALRDFLKADQGLPSWPKATGGKGLHVMVPLDGSRDHDEAREYARVLAGGFAERDRRYTIGSSLKQRTGMLFLDYLRNGRGQTAIGTYSPRARPNFPVAIPLTWRQVEKNIRSDAFTMTTFRKRKAPV